MENNGKYVVTFIPSIERENNGFAASTSSLREAKTILDTIANYTLFLHNNSLMKDYSNAGFITKFNEETKEWDEIDHDHD